MGNSNQGKVVVVTGASAGVGRAVVAEFARQGAHLGLIARGQERLEATKREVEELGGKGDRAANGRGGRAAGGSGG